MFYGKYFKIQISKLAAINTREKDISERGEDVN